jgi:uncharacterized protein (DUF58 family)
MALSKQKSAISKFLDPTVVSRLSGMELKARLIVEGFIAGMHRSPYHGFSVEFAEYRQYMQGDNIKNLDWKVFGKTDRFYVKVYEEETNLKSTILLDKSGSMGFSSAGGSEKDKHIAIDKLTYGGLLAASLSYMMIHQQDAVSLCAFDDQIRTLLPHRSVRKHLFFLLANLENLEAGSRTRISSALHYIAERIRRRGLIILISDLMDNPDKILMGLKHFRHRKHEVIVFHILDPRELSQGLASVFARAVFRTGSEMDQATRPGVQSTSNRLQSAYDADAVRPGANHVFEQTRQDGITPRCSV